MPIQHNARQHHDMTAKHDLSCGYCIGTVNAKNYDLYRGLMHRTSLSAQNKTSNLHMLIQTFISD